MTDDLDYAVDVAKLHRVYSLLADATQAAATGDPNGCASLAADAKDELTELHTQGAPLEEVLDE